MQVAQGAQALGLIDASPFPVVALGDFNSAGDGSTTPTCARLTASLTDTWAATQHGEPGYSCCQAELLDHTVRATQRIDLVPTKGPWVPDSAERTTGGRPFRAAPAPVWASDHFWVTARLELQH